MRHTLHQSNFRLVHNNIPPLPTAMLVVFNTAGARNHHTTCLVWTRRPLLNSPMLHQRKSLQSLRERSVIFNGMFRGISHISYPAERDNFLTSHDEITMRDAMMRLISLHYSHYFKSECHQVFQLGQTMPACQRDQNGWKKPLSHAIHAKHAMPCDVMWCHGAVSFSHAWTLIQTIQAVHILNSLQFQVLSKNSPNSMWSITSARFQSKGLRCKIYSSPWIWILVRRIQLGNSICCIQAAEPTLHSQLRSQHLQCAPARLFSS